MKKWDLHNSEMMGFAQQYTDVVMRLLESISFSVLFHGSKLHEIEIDKWNHARRSYLTLYFIVSSGGPFVHVMISPHHDEIKWLNWP
jgi:hypothetical protein